MKKFLLISIIIFLLIPCCKKTPTIPGTPTTTTTTTTTIPTTTTTTTTTTTLQLANVIMKEGPNWKETDWTFTYFGIVKNIGNKEAKWIKIYIYLYDSGGMSIKTLIDYNYTYADQYNLDPGKESPWDVIWWDEDKTIRNKIDKTKTKYEIIWD